MIPEYKLYHGAVLADLADRARGGVSVRRRAVAGRLLNYVINDVVGLQVKYSTARLRPWTFSFPKAHIDHLRDLSSEYTASFVALVCHTDGLVCVPVEELLPFLTCSDESQAWLRADRRKREMYRLYGPRGEFQSKLCTTSEPIIGALEKAGTVGHVSD